LFDEPSGPRATSIIPLDRSRHRTYHYWHTFVPDVAPGQVYAFRAHGSYAPERGLRFDGEKVLLDPYGRAVAVPHGYDRDAAKRPGNNAAAP
jgi:glycogen operon protein